MEFIAYLERHDVQGEDTLTDSGEPEGRVGGWVREAS